MARGHTRGTRLRRQVSTGYLFPMAAGLCFVERPATFVPKDSISSVEFARAGGGSATFDFMVHTEVTRSPREVKV